MEPVLKIEPNRRGIDWCRISDSVVEMQPQATEFGAAPSLKPEPIGMSMQKTRLDPRGPLLRVLPILARRFEVYEK